MATDIIKATLLIIILLVEIYVIVTYGQQYFYIWI